jgi:hypothetical protein
VEILTAIISLIDDTSTLAACSLVNSTFNDLVIPRLYTKVVIAQPVQLPLSLCGIDNITGDSSHLRRKPNYFRHLTSLIIKKIPRIPFPLLGPSSAADLFPSLGYIEFEHSIAGWDPVIPPFQRMHHIRHVCISNYSAGNMLPGHLGGVPQDWRGVGIPDVLRLVHEQQPLRQVSARGAHDVAEAEGDPGVPRRWRATAMGGDPVKPVFSVSYPGSVLGHAESTTFRGVEEVRDYGAG